MFYRTNDTVDRKNKKNSFRAHNPCFCEEAVLSTRFEHIISVFPAEAFAVFPLISNSVTVQSRVDIVLRGGGGGGVGEGGNKIVIHHPTEDIVSYCMVNQGNQYEPLYECIVVLTLENK